MNKDKEESSDFNIMRDPNGALFGVAFVPAAFLTIVFGFAKMNGNISWHPFWVFFPIILWSAARFIDIVIDVTSEIREEESLRRFDNERKQ